MKTYIIEVETTKGNTIWTNGGKGYTKSELKDPYHKLINDDRVINYTIKAMNNKEEKAMTTTNNEFELNGATYTITEKGYCYKTTGAVDKKGNPISRRIPKHAYEAAFEEYVQGRQDEADVNEWEEQADAERKDRKDKQDKADKRTEESFNKKQAKKPRKSKDIGYTHESGLTLTAKQVDFIKHIPDTNFYEHGLDSTPWCDVLTDEIGGQFAGKPMTVGAMISTLKEKNLIAVGVDKVNGKKAKWFCFTELGKEIAKNLGLK